MGAALNNNKAAAVTALIFFTAVPAYGQVSDFRSEFPPQFTETPMGVNLQTGKFRYHAYDFAIGPFSLKRGFNQTDFQFLGSSYWSTKNTSSGSQMSVLNVSLGETKLQFVISGSTYTGAYISWNSPAIGWKLERMGAGHLLTDKTGNTYYFADNGSASGYPTPSGRPTQIIYADGATLNLTYDSTGRVQFIGSNRGYAVRYEYVSSTQNKICGFNLAMSYADANTSCSASNYVVTVNGTQLSGGSLQATSITDVLGQTSTITYTTGGVRCITLPNSSTCEFTNTYGTLPGEVVQFKDDHVRIQTDAAGGEWRYNYVVPGVDDPPRYPGGPPVLTESMFSMPGEPPNQWGAYPYYAKYADGLVTELKAPGTGVLTFTYDGVNLKTITYPEGNKLTINRDVIGNAPSIVDSPKPNTGLPPITRTQSFPTAQWSATSICDAASPKLCTKPIVQTDAKNNQTDYTYDPAHGGTLTMTLPAAANGIRPQTRHEYAQRYAWIKNTAGSYTPASSPIWVKTRERFCRATAASGQTCSGGAADEVVTDYEYGPDSGPNNLLLRGVAVTADGQTRRTCYGYDSNGRKVSETQPKAGLGVCP